VVAEPDDLLQHGVVAVEQVEGREDRAAGDGDPLDRAAAGAGGHHVGPFRLLPAQVDGRISIVSKRPAKVVATSVSRPILAPISRYQWRM
jgi:hypothetical protein